MNLDKAIRRQSSSPDAALSLKAQPVHRKLADALARLAKGEPARRIALEAERAALSADLLMYSDGRLRVFGIRGYIRPE